MFVVLMVLRIIGWLKTTMMLLLMGIIPPTFGPGLTSATDGGGMTTACTVKPAGTISTSAPVVVVTSTGPSGALEAMVILKVTLVAVADTTGPGEPAGCPPTL